MASGIWPSVSGADAQITAVETISNNLANVDTPGFKKDEPVFREYLSVLERDQLGAALPRKPVQDKDFYRLDGRDQSFVITDGTYTHFRQGHLRVTRQPTDVALDGPGFFEVSTPAGVRYTKQGSFKLTKEGRLVTAQGYPVLSSQPGGLASALPATAVQPSQGWQPTQGGVVAGQTNSADPALAARYIELKDLEPGETGLVSDGPRIFVSESGDVFNGEKQIAKLSVVEFQDLNKLRKDGQQLFTNDDPTNRAPASSLQTKVLQGVIETSNVNPIEEMTNLMKAHRLYEQNLKAIRTYDQLMEKESNEVGKLR